MIENGSDSKSVKAHKQLYKCEFIGDQNKNVWYLSQKLTIGGKRIYIFK